MITFDELIASFADHQNGVHKAIAPQEWSQGRTLYGGMSAALCQVAARQIVGDETPLRAAQFCFVGPAGGNLTGDAELLRRGKSTAIVEATLRTEQGIGTRAILSYGKSRESRIAQDTLKMPDVPPPSDCPWLWGKEPSRENITSFPANFDSRRAGGHMPLSEQADGELLVWVRHHRSAESDQTAALLALGDVLPPACVTMFAEWAPISTMTWSMEILADNIEVKDRWFLFKSVAEHTTDGYSSQAMYLWDEAGNPVIAARQNVTIFV